MRRRSSRPRPARRRPARHSDASMTIFFTSSTDAIRPTPRTISQAPFELNDVAADVHDCSGGRPPRPRSAAGCRRAGGSGSTSIWYCCTWPPTDATSATPGTAFSWYLMNQSCIDRSSRREWFGLSTVYQKMWPTPVASGPSAGYDPGWHLARQQVHPLEDARTCEVQIDLVLEDDVDHREAERGLGSHDPDAGQPLQVDGERIGDLVLDLLRAVSRASR